MNRFALIGASYKTIGVERLGHLAVPKAEVERRLPELAAALGVSELAYLSTCNRIEFIVAHEKDVEAQVCRDKIAQQLAKRGDETEARKLFRAWSGEGAVEHLFLVAAGLDSAQAGEREIYAQVRIAWQTARAAGTLGPQLDYLFAEALRAAQDVHAQAARPANADSLANFAVRHTLAHLGGKRGRVVLLGVSPMTRFCARALSAQDVSLRVVNRTPEVAAELAAEVGGESQSLEAFKAAPGLVDVIIAAVGGAEPVLDLAAVKGIAATAPHGVLIIDLGVPPNADPAVVSIPGVNRIGMDQVVAEAAEGRNARLGELASARIIIDNHLERLRREYAVRESASLIQLMGNHYQRLAAESLRRLPRTDGNDKDLLKNWAEAFARRLAHAPIKGLRTLAAEAGPAAVQAYLRGVEEALGDDDKTQEKRS